VQYLLTGKPAHSWIRHRLSRHRYQHCLHSVFTLPSILIETSPITVMSHYSGNSAEIGSPRKHFEPDPENSEIEKRQNKNGDNNEFNDQEILSDKNESSDEDEHNDNEEDSNKDEDEEPANGYRGLRHRLREIGIPYFDKNRVFSCFWPAAELRTTMTPERILAQLQAYDTTESGLERSTTLEVLAEKILSHHCKVFAVLVLISKGRCIQSVMDARVKDKHLPLQLKDERQDSRLYMNDRGTVQGKRLRIFDGPGWTPILRQAFFEYQHAFNPHVLSFNDEQRTPRHESFDGKVVLPFTNEEVKQRGGFGIVTKVTIPESCHRFHAQIKSVCLSLYRSGPHHLTQHNRLKQATLSQGNNSTTMMKKNSKARLMP
jgi:hypothetical protein